MKKFFAIALLAGTLVACGSGETKTEETVTDTQTVVTPPAAPDTVQVVTDTTTTVTVDTVQK